MILDTDSIDTLPSDVATSPGEQADDDVIFDRRRSLEAPAPLPGIAEEEEHMGDDPLCDFDLTCVPCVASTLVAPNVVKATSLNFVAAIEEEKGLLGNPTDDLIFEALNVGEKAVPSDSVTHSPVSSGQEDISEALMSSPVRGEQKKVSFQPAKVKFFETESSLDETLSPRNLDGEVKKKVSFGHAISATDGNKVFGEAPKIEESFSDEVSAPSNLEVKKRVSFEPETKSVVLGSPINLHEETKIENPEKERDVSLETGDYMSKDEVSFEPDVSIEQEYQATEKAIECTEEKCPELVIESSEEKSPVGGVLSSEGNSPERAIECTEEKCPEGAIQSTEEKSPVGGVQSPERNSPERAIECTEEKCPEGAIQSTEEKSPERVIQSTEANVPEKAIECSEVKSPCLVQDFEKLITTETNNKISQEQQLWPSQVEIEVTTDSKPNEELVNLKAEILNVDVIPHVDLSPDVVDLILSLNVENNPCSVDVVPVLEPDNVAPVVVTSDNRDLPNIDVLEETAVLEVAGDSGSDLLLKTFSAGEDTEVIASTSPSFQPAVEINPSVTETKVSDKKSSNQNVSDAPENSLLAVDESKISPIQSTQMTSQPSLAPEPPETDSDTVQEAEKSENSKQEVLLPHSDSSSAFAIYKPPVKPQEVQPPPLQRQTSADKSKENKGVLTKILEFVGVKKKDEEVLPTSVFYDAPETVSEVQESPVVVSVVEAEAKGVEGIQDILKATDLSAVKEDSSKKRSPSPRIDIPNVPTTNLIEATPPSASGQKPPRRDPEALTVDNFIPETPPVVQKKTPINFQPQIDRNDLRNEIEDIISKAKLIASEQTEDDPIYSNILVAALEEPPKPPIALCEDFEEIKVTPVQERGRPREATSSKLAGQILKAIPPPRRRAISDSRPTTVDFTLEKRLNIVHEQPSHSTPSPSVSPHSSMASPVEDLASPPPVPPRRRKSKQRQEPQPPPKRKPKK